MSHSRSPCNDGPRLALHPRLMRPRNCGMSLPPIQEQVHELHVASHEPIHAATFIIEGASTLQSTQWKGWQGGKSKCWPDQQNPRTAPEIRHDYSGLMGPNSSENEYKREIRIRVSCKEINLKGRGVVNLRNCGLIPPVGWTRRRSELCKCEQTCCPHLSQ